LLVIALATLTWGFSVAKTDVINAEVDVASFQSAHATQLNSVNASVPNIPSLNPFKAQLISLNESAAAHDLPALPTVGMQFRSQDEKTQ